MKIRALVVKMVGSMIVFMALASYAQNIASPMPSSPPGAPQLTAEQLDQLLAPIALYPDSLLAQILMSATYPPEIVEGDRWLQDPNNSALTGSELNAALQQQQWDPSIKSLIPFPPILRMMDDNLSWTEQLGDAFLADQRAVMDSVQRLRRKALASGALTSTPYQAVSLRDSVIVVEPPASDIVYVPVYDPYVVYAPWPYDDYPPYYFTGYFGVVVGGGPSFGWFGVGIFPPLWGWSSWEWQRHRLHIDRDRFNDINFRHRPVESDEWNFDPAHRHGVPYRYENERTRFQPRTVILEERRSFRGYPPTEGSGAAAPGVQPLPQVVQPLPQVVKPLPPVVHPLPPSGQTKPSVLQPRPPPGRERGVVVPQPRSGSRQPPRSNPSGAVQTSRFNPNVGWVRQPLYAAGDGAVPCVISPRMAAAGQVLLVRFRQPG